MAGAGRRTRRDPAGTRLFRPTPSAPGVDGFTVEARRGEAAVRHARDGSLDGIDAVPAPAATEHDEAAGRGVELLARQVVEVVVVAVAVAEAGLAFGVLAPPHAVHGEHATDGRLLQ